MLLINIWLFFYLRPLLPTLKIITLNIPWRMKVYFQCEIIINVLVSSFHFTWITVLWVYGHYKYCNSFRAGIDIRIWRLSMSDSDVYRQSPRWKRLWNILYSLFCSLHPSMPLMVTSCGQRHCSRPNLMDMSDSEEEEEDSRENSLKLWWIGR